VSGLESAEAALQTVKENRPHIVLIDLLLPGMDGLRLARMLKEDPETKDILAVAVTAFPEKYPKEAALAAGCDAYLVKPISTRDISGQLEQALRTVLPKQNE